MTTKLRKAVKDLSKYYGRVAVSPYRGIDSSVGQAPPNDPLQSYLQSYSSTPDEGNVIKEFMERLTSRSQTTVGTSTILDRMSTLLSDNDSFRPPLLITPDERDNPRNAMAIINTPVDGKKTRQGTLSPGNREFYTMEDACSAPISQDFPAPKLSVLQIFSPVNSISAADNDLVALYLNAVSTLKASQAVPYMDIKVVTPEPIGQDTPAPSMSLGRFLGIKKRGGLTPGTADYALINGVPLITNFTTDIGPDVNKKGEPKEEMRIVSGIEIFTSPQTMVNAQDAYEGGGIARGEMLDPFQPFMSLEGLKLNVTSPGGFINERTGEISFVLHDRARMDELIALISPHNLGKTRLVITWGYSHPSGQDPNSDDAVGIMLDSMKVTETFIVTTSSFSFSGPNVKISMKIVPIASKELKSINILYADDDEDSVDIRRQMESLNIALVNYNEGRQKKISVPTVLRSYDNISLNGLNAEERKAITELVKGVKGTSLANLVENIFGRNGTGGSVATISKRRLEQLRSIFASMKATPDPFLPEFTAQGGVNTSASIWTGGDPPRSSSPSYVSLGKVISTFVGKSLRSTKNQSLQPDDEVQLIFHPFNSEAAGMQDYNLAQFIIEYSELERVLERKLSLSGNMTLINFLGILKQYFVGDIGAMSYDLLSPRNRSVYKLNLESGGRRPENQYYRVPAPKKNGDTQGAAKTGGNNGAGSSNNNAAGVELADRLGIEIDSAARAATAPAPAKPSETQTVQRKRPEFDAVFESDKQAQLAKIYGVSEGASVSFRPTNLSYVLETCPKSVDWNDDPERSRGTVVKLHITDAASTHLSGLGDFIKAASDDLFVPLLRRKTDAEAFPYTSAHSVYSTGFMSKLLERQLVKPITLSELKSMNSNEDLGINEDTFRTISENYVIFKPSSNVTFKEIIKSIYPTLTWGTESSGIISANLSTLDDSSLQSTMIVRSSNYDDSASPDLEGLPLTVTPTTLSMELLGCPFVGYAQQFYIDFGTNTDVDNVYAFTGVDHEIQPGKFKTSTKLVQTKVFGRFYTMKSELQRTVLNAFLARFNAKKTN